MRTRKEARKVAKRYEELERLLTKLGPDWYLAASGGGGFNFWHLPMTRGITGSSRRCQFVGGTTSLAGIIAMMKGDKVAEAMTGP